MFLVFFAKLFHIRVYCSSLCAGACVFLFFCNLQNLCLCSAVAAEMHEIWRSSRKSYIICQAWWVKCFLWRFSPPAWTVFILTDNFINKCIIVLCTAKKPHNFCSQIDAHMTKIRLYWHDYNKIQYCQSTKYTHAIKHNITATLKVQCTTGNWT